MTKLERLKELREKVNLNTFGVEKLTDGNKYIFVANHNCLLDIFYLPMSLSFPIIELISSRLIFNKEDINRYNLVNNCLYSMPIEAHGGPKYSNLCLSPSIDILKEGYSLSIFPEGAYISEKIIHKGRTGASRILFDAKRNNIDVKLIPVAIDVKGIYDLDTYHICDNEVDIHFLDSIDYVNSYEKYINSDSFNEKNDSLHEPIDMAMKDIAECLEREYSDEYIKLFPKGNVMSFDGKKIKTNDLKENDYIEYGNNLNKRLSKQLSVINY